MVKLLSQRTSTPLLTEQDCVLGDQRRVDVPEPPSNVLEKPLMRQEPRVTLQTYFPLSLTGGIDGRINRACYVRTALIK